LSPQRIDQVGRAPLKPVNVGPTCPQSRPLKVKVLTASARGYRVLYKKAAEPTACRRRPVDQASHLHHQTSNPTKTAARSKTTPRTTRSCFRTRWSASA